MPGQRSRQGCDECRRRRRKCDEAKPACGQCTNFNRSCAYSIKLVWGGRKFKKSCFAQCLHGQGGSARETNNGGEGFVYGTDTSTPADAPTSALVVGIPQSARPRAYSPEPHSLVPLNLPNGITLPSRYRKLLSYFAEDILASLSTHPSIHHDLREGLVPVMLGSPHLLSASLALSAAGLLSRGMTEIDGADILRVIEHLQSSGLSLLRTALTSQQNHDTQEILLVTCLIWCLADVFAAGQGNSSWRVHLQGFKAILDQREAVQQLVRTPGPTKPALRHLYLLYLSLQTLPHVPALALPDQTCNSRSTIVDQLSGPETSIDGFLGYDEELLDILQTINQIGCSDQDASTKRRESDLLLARLSDMIRRDESHPPNVSIASLRPEASRDFFLCHQSFQQATLIYLYRLYDTPSASQQIRLAVNSISEMIDNMTQGQPCHTWVAMSMPLFTIGCEAFTVAQQNFVRDKIQKLETCLGSLHVRLVRQALEDMWRIRSELGDQDGQLCATGLLERLQYSVILF
ncbi:fungal-specific transcription factor domain-containing protein [Stachybotrys elegans]|uniref:Fungal-specific transcription factor domain-containing protein n=1 Tax=Stachybotrys elegans TaxID=80388 RepID=A0A8K0T1G4_9HYPO|nr:fungal-specific transcription factor domain-containing protein [Stachybotrys elegans]